MAMDSDVGAALDEMLVEILRVFDARVPAEGPFDDVRFKRQVVFGDPETAAPGLLELTVMAMDDSVNPANRRLRFLALRVKRSPRGGTVSSTCFHGTADQLRADLEKSRQRPELLLHAIEELLFGLPEETNPDVWR